MNKQILFDSDTQEFLEAIHNAPYDMIQRVIRLLDFSKTATAEEMKAFYRITHLNDESRPVTADTIKAVDQFFKVANLCEIFRGLTIKDCDRVTRLANFLKGSSVAELCNFFNEVDWPEGTIPSKETCIRIDNYLNKFQKQSECFS